jgi:hypothetical protein
MYRSIVATLGLLVASTAAFAGDNTPRVDQRQERQQERIAQGVESGQLNQREAARLEAQQVRNEAVETRVKSDGVVTPAERARLEARENRTSRHIYRQKHDGQQRH